MALCELDRPYVRRAVATKLLHVKRPHLVPVLDSLVVRQLGWPPDTGPAATVRVIDHVRVEGQRNLAELTAIGKLLRDHQVDRPAVRILDALLWSTDEDSFLSQLPSFVQEVRTSAL